MVPEKSVSIPYDDDHSGATVRWWTDNAAEYYAEHGAFLGDVQFTWCPEGLREPDVQLLGRIEQVRTSTVLEVGAGAAQCSRWLKATGVDRVIALDASHGMLEMAARANTSSGVSVDTVLADARNIPMTGATFDIAFTAFGALSFVPDPHRIHAEVMRVLTPGGRWVFAQPHPMRWALPDDPTQGGLRFVRSYFDREPYLETDDAGMVTYAEYHRTLSGVMNDVVGAGFVIESMLEPEWPSWNDSTWGGWGPERGVVVPGSLIVAAKKPE